MTTASLDWINHTTDKPKRAFSRTKENFQYDIFERLCDPTIGHINNPSGVDPTRSEEERKLVETFHPSLERGYASRLAQIAAVHTHHRFTDRTFAGINASTLGKPSYLNEAARREFTSKEATEEFIRELGEMGYIFHPYTHTFYRFGPKNLMLSSVCFDVLLADETNSCWNIALSFDSRKHGEELEALIARHTKDPPRAQDREEIITINAVTKEGFETSASTVLDTEELAHQSFYPWMGGITIRDYFSDFMASKANVLILYGLPGTGKSTMIRTAIKELRLKALLTSNPDVMTNAGFINFCGKQLASGEGRRFDMLIAEDADALMTPRKEGNQLMQMLLNATSGIVTANQFKIILTTNETDLSKFDQALLRTGRCFDLHEFGFMDNINAMKVRADLKMPPINIKPGKYTLAQASNIGHTAMLDYGGSQIVMPRFGLRENDKIAMR